MEKKKDLYEALKENIMRSVTDHLNEDIDEVDMFAEIRATIQKHKKDYLAQFKK